MSLKRILMERLDQEIDEITDKAIDKLLERQDDLDKLADRLLEKGMDRADELADILVDKVTGKLLDSLTKEDWLLMRISWSEYALLLADSASKRSEDPYRQVGACALGFDNRVLGVGYNGLAPGKVVDSRFWDDRDLRRVYMIHAEANCLSLFKHGECRLLAVTLLPCSSCATLIAGYGIKTVIYRDVYEFDDKALDIFDFYNVECKRFLSDGVWNDCNYYGSYDCENEDLTRVR